MKIFEKMVRMECHAEGGEKLIRGVVLYENKRITYNGETAINYYVYTPDCQVVRIRESSAGIFFLGIVGFLRIYDLLDQLK